MNLDHPNSKVIELRRKDNSFLVQVNKNRTEIYKRNKVGLGSYFDKSNQLATGLSHDEINLLLPTLVNRPADHYEFLQYVSVFYKDITTSIPDEGLKLEIGLKKDNSLPISIDNLPIDIEDYVRYRHLIKHPWLAKNEAEARGNALKRAFIYDNNLVKKDQLYNTELKDEAAKLYFGLKENAFKVDQMLTVMEVNVDTLAAEDKKIELKRLSEEKSADFIRYAQDDLLENLYIVDKLIDGGILTFEGGQIIRVEENTVIGEHKRDAARFLQNPKNSKEKTILLRRYKEYQNKELINESEGNTGKN